MRWMPGSDDSLTTSRSWSSFGARFFLHGKSSRVRRNEGRTRDRCFLGLATSRTRRDSAFDRLLSADSLEARGRLPGGAALGANDSRPALLSEPVAQCECVDPG